MRRALLIAALALVLAPAAAAAAPRPTDAALESTGYALSAIALELAEPLHTDDGDAWEWEVDVCTARSCALRLNDVAVRVVACRWLTRRRGRCLVRARLDSGRRCEAKIGVRDRLRWAWLERPNPCTRLADELNR